MVRWSWRGDRRTASLDLTPTGQAAVQRWKTVNERLLSLALGSLPEASRSTLEDALPALAGAVDELADDPQTEPAAS